MEEILIYLLKSAAVLNLFWLVYVCLLKKDVTFAANRKFLLTGILAAGILPAVTFTRRIWIEPVSNYSPVNFSETPATEATSLFNVWEIAGWIYLVVAFFLMVRLGLQVFSVVKLISALPVRKKQDLYFIETTKNFTPFSFFTYIIYNPRAHSKKELKLILCHEKVHARQRHSIDVLLANLSTTLLWFNPLSWFYKNGIEQNLEFIADQETVAASGEKKAYQHTLVKILAGKLPPPLTNQFYQSLIKKRIIMLNNNHKKQSQPWKMMLLFPLILAFMFSFNVKTEARILSSEEQISTHVTKEEGQQILEAFFSENTSKNDLENSQNAFAEKDVRLEWDQVEFSGDKLKRIHFTYTLETGDSRQFKSEIDENGNLVPFKLRIVFHQDKVATIDILAASNKEPGKNKLGIKEVEKKKTGALPENVIYKIDGKEVEKEALDDLDPEMIAEIRVLKDKKAIEEVGKKGRNGLVLVTTKRKQEAVIQDKRQDEVERTKLKIKKLEKKGVLPIPADSLIAFEPTKIEAEKSNPQSILPRFKTDKSLQPLVFVEGEAKDMNYLKTAIEPEDIKSLNVIKGPAAVEKYGENGAGGAIEVLLKK